MEKIQQSLRKFSSVIFVFANIGYVAAIVSVCISACALIGLAFTGSLSFAVELGNGTTLHGLFAEGAVNTATDWATMAYVVTYSAFLIVIMRMLMRLFKNMRDNYTPFTMENADLFKKMAIWMIVASVVPETIGQSVGMICAKIMSDTFSADFGSSFSLIAVLVLFAMSMVFKYGCALQEQADTTL